MQHVYTQVTAHIQKLYTHVHGLEQYTNTIHSFKCASCPQKESQRESKGVKESQRESKRVNEYATVIPAVPHAAAHRTHFFLPSPGVLRPRTSVRAPFLGLALAVVCLPVGLFVCSPRKGARTEVRGRRTPGEWCVFTCRFVCVCVLLLSFHDTMRLRSYT